MKKTSVDFSADVERLLLRGQPLVQKAVEEFRGCAKDLLQNAAAKGLQAGEHTKFRWTEKEQQRSSRIVMDRLPLGKAARATRAVSCGTGSMA